MTKKKITLGQSNLSIEDLEAVARYGAKVELSSRAKNRVKKATEFLKASIKKNEVIYGINTGFGFLSNVRIETEDLEALQQNILFSHATGVGDPLSDEVVRGMMLLRAGDLSRGHSGMRLEVIERILFFLNRNILPVVPSQGSVGASGDLAPLAHLALPIIGAGEVKRNGEIVSTASVMKSLKLKPIVLEPKEGLALINGTQLMTAWGCLSLLDAERIADAADGIGAMSVEALRGTAAAFDPLVHKIRPHEGQKEVAKRLRKFLIDGKRSQIASSHEDCDKVQDPYSFRCMPQVHGVSRDTFQFVRKVLETEINSVTDNPLLFPEQRKVISGGNFHGQYVSMALDFLSIAISELASISQERVSKLVNPAMSQLPAFLTKKSGLNSGFMIVQVAAASIVSENKTLAHPASVDSIPTNVDKEDHVSMGAWSARKAAQIVVNTRKVLAMELMAAAQGIDLLRPLKSTKRIEGIHQRVRKVVKRLDNDRTFYDDIEKIDKLLKDRTLEPHLCFKR